MSSVKHKATNQITKVVVEGTNINRYEGVARAAIHFFSILLAADPNLCLNDQESLLENTPNVIGLDHNKSICAIPSNEEVMRDVFYF